MDAKTPNCKESERVAVLEERISESGGLRFKKVEIKYSNSDLFYSGWIQDFGDARTGPTFFEQNYKNFDLDRECVFKMEKYWDMSVLNNAQVALYDAVEVDLDEIIDLTFQNYFDGGYNRISAYQGLNHKVDDDHSTLCLKFGGSIFGYLYIDYAVNAFRGGAYFDSIFCAHGIRDHGVGSALISAGLDRIKNKGFKYVSSVIIGTPSHCENVARLLDRHGFNVLECYQKSNDWVEATMEKTF